MNPADGPEANPQDATAHAERLAAPDRRSAFTSVRWSVLAVLGRQLPQMVASLVLARVLGPETYGVISAATVYVTFTTLLLDQGLSVALVQLRTVKQGLSGAVASVNLLNAVLLGAITVAASGLVAGFFSAPGLQPLLAVLGCGLLLKGAAITPRALLQRELRFRSIAIADITGGTVGGLVGIVAVLAGAGIWSMAWMVLVTDVLIAVLMIAFTRSAWPNLRFRLLGEVLPFSLRIFGSNALAFLSRNLDNILVGRILGVAALSLYSMSYRVLVIPVQFIGQTVNRVVFPLFSRVNDQRAKLASGLLMAIEMLAFAAIPTMSAVAVAAPELILLALGREWLLAAPILTVLAIAGARETVFNVTSPLMRAVGAGKLIVRYEWLAAALQLGGILIGLQFGVLGVAIGLTVAGFALTPVLMAIQRRFTGVSAGAQLSRMLPPVHASLWGAAAYLGVRFSGASEWVTLIAGSAAYLLLAFVVLRFVHRKALARTWQATREIFNPRSRAATSSAPVEEKDL